MSTNTTTPSNTPSTSGATTTGPRPVGVIHLIFGLIFAGLAALWLIGNANDADFPDLAKGVPAVLIGAGLVGLGASAVNHRRARARLLAREVAEVAEDAAPEPQEPATQEPATEQTDVLATTDGDETPEHTLVIENEKDES